MRVQPWREDEGGRERGTTCGRGDQQYSDAHDSFSWVTNGLVLQCPRRERHGPERAQKVRGRPSGRAGPGPIAVPLSNRGDGPAKFVVVISHAIDPALVQMPDLVASRS